MRAFVVHHAHINAIVNHAHHVLGHSSAWDLIVQRHQPQALGQILYYQNLRSVHELSPRATIPHDYHWHNCPHVVTAVAFLKLLDGLEEQSNGTNDWSVTMACKIIEVLRRDGIKRLHGYDRAPSTLEIDLATPAVAHLLRSSR